MKIEKQFIPLILSGEKRYEIRNRIQNPYEREGVYKIQDKFFELTYYESFKYYLIVWTKQNKVSCKLFMHTQQDLLFITDDG